MATTTQRYISADFVYTERWPVVFAKQLIKTSTTLRVHYRLLGVNVWVYDKLSWIKDGWVVYDVTRYLVGIPVYHYSERVIS